MRNSTTRKTTEKKLYAATNTQLEFSKLHETLVGHIPIEASNLFDYFLKDGEQKCCCRAKKT